MLREFKESGQPMKLGTVQRWVRDIDINTLCPDKVKVRVLDLVLRCTEEFREWGMSEDFGVGMIYHKEEWEPCAKIQAPENWRDEKMFSRDDIKVVNFEKAADRMPPNFYDLSIYTNLKEIKISNPDPVIRIDVPAVPGAFVLANVISVEDCNIMRNMVETMGFELDIPIGQSTEQGHDSRAKGAVWVIS